MRLEIEVTHLWFLAAGALGAFGNQLLYWRNVWSRRRDIRGWMVPVSVLYVLTGAGIGFFAGVDFDSHLLALGTGGAWPTALKAMNDVRLYADAVRQKLGLAAGGG